MRQAPAQQDPRPPAQPDGKPQSASRTQPSVRCADSSLLKKGAKKGASLERGAKKASLRQKGGGIRRKPDDGGFRPGKLPRKIPRSATAAAPSAAATPDATARRQAPVRLADGKPQLRFADATLSPLRGQLPSKEGSQKGSLP